MPKKMILGTLLILSVFMISYILIPKSNQFKSEYEKLNGKKTSNGKKYIDVNIGENNVFVYSSYDEVLKILDSTGVVYFGFPECPWCRNAVSVLNEAADESGIDKIYYLNNHDDRNELVFKDGQVITIKKGKKKYEELLSKIGDNASIYEGLKDEKIKRIYYPTVVTIKNGEIKDYIVGTVSSQKDPYKPLTKSQKSELKSKYVDAISKIMVCSQNEKC